MRCRLLNPDKYTEEEVEEARGWALTHATYVEHSSEHLGDWEHNIVEMEFDNGFPPLFYVGTLAGEVDDANSPYFERMADAEAWVESH